MYFFKYFWYEKTALKWRLLEYFVFISTGSSAGGVNSSAFNQTTSDIW